MVGAVPFAQHVRGTRWRNLASKLRQVLLSSKEKESYDAPRGRCEATAGSQCPERTLSIDFVSDTLSDASRYRALTVVDPLQLRMRRHRGGSCRRVPRRHRLHRRWSSRAWCIGEFRREDLGRAQMGGAPRPSPSLVPTPKPEILRAHDAPASRPPPSPKPDATPRFPPGSSLLHHADGEELTERSVRKRISPVGLAPGRAGASSRGHESASS